MGSRSSRDRTYPLALGLIAGCPQRGEATPKTHRSTNSPIRRHMSGHEKSFLLDVHVDRSHGRGIRHRANRAKKSTRAQDRRRGSDEKAPFVSSRPWRQVTRKEFKSGIIWRVFNEHAEANGAHKLIAVSREASPTISLPEGAYIVHAAFGLAGAPAGSSSTGERSRSV